MDTARVQHALGFSSDDIVANRQGRITEAQLRHHLHQRRASVKGRVLLGALAAAAMLVLALSAGKGLWAVLVVLAVVVVAVVESDQRYRRRLMNAQVERADGQVTKTTHGDPSTAAASQYIEIKDQTPRFQIPAPLWEDFEEHLPYTFYFVRDTETLLSVDAPSGTPASARARPVVRQP